MPSFSEPEPANEGVQAAKASHCTCEVERDGSTATITVAGEIDLLGSPGLGETLDRLIEDGVQNMTLVMQDVTFMDSSGLHVLLRASKRLHANGAFFIKSPSEVVSRLFDVASLKGHFEVI